ncbi:MAG: exodeoxyribonuclease III [Candidatus Hodarchaeota archaeon]
MTFPNLPYEEQNTLKIVSWNINGIKACISKGLLEFVQNEDADIYCFQETKTSLERQQKTPLLLEAHEQHWHFAEKKGYSGTLTLTKESPLSVFRGIDSKGYDKEGRTLTLEYDDFYLTNAYFPNASRGLTRLDFKLDFNARLLRFAEKLRKKKPVVITGDFNVSHKEIDIARPKANRGHAGFTDQERAWFGKLLSKGYSDTFRQFTDEGDHYTW